METESDDFGINRTRRGALRRRCNENHRSNEGNDVSNVIEHEPIVPCFVNNEEIRCTRMNSVREPNLLVQNSFLTVPREPLDRRSESIKRAQEGMRPEERKALIKDDFAYVFYKIAGDDELLDAFELQYFMHLVYKQKYPKASDFNLETCRAMIASLDDTMRGKITFTQFKKLWMRLMKWAHAYNTSDLDQDGSMDRTEFFVALTKLNIPLNEKQADTLMNKFQTREHVIQLDDFIQVCCKARSAKWAFRNACKGKIADGSATLGEFLMEILKT